jgi:hypothetical protein
MSACRMRMQDLIAAPRGAISRLIASAPHCRISSYLLGYYAIYTVFVMALFMSVAQGAQWSPFWDAVAARADAKVIDGVNDKGEQTRRIELSSGVTYFLERHGDQISVLDGDVSGHGPVQCYWEIYVAMRVHAALCSPGEDPKLEADLDLALDRINDFIVENSLVPITKPQLMDAILKRKQRALGQSQADRRKQCDAEDAGGFTGFVKGTMADRDKWINDLLSVKRPPVMNPCM